MNVPTPSVAASVRAELRAADLTQERIGEALGLDQTSVSRRMKGKIPWRADELAQLSRVFGIPVERFYAPRPVYQAATA